MWKQFECSTDGEWYLDGEVSEIPECKGETRVYSSDMGRYVTVPIHRLTFATTVLEIDTHANNVLTMWEKCT